MPYSGAALLTGVIGVGLLYAALHNQSLLKTAQNVIKGEVPGAGTATAAAPLGASIATGVQGALQAQGTPAANKALGAVMATAYGWGPGTKDWPYLETGWQEESGWNQYAANVPGDPSGAAYGIPQANPGSKMASAGADWLTSPSTQIKWGLGYIKSTYGAPSKVPGWTPTGPAAGYVGY
jgi:hypothetical protein